MFLNVFPNVVANYIFYILSCVMFMMEMTILFRKRKNAKIEDKRTARLLFSCIFVSFFLAFFFMGSRIGLLPKEYHWVSWLGFVVILIGMGFRWYCVSVLGKYFTGVVLIQKEHQLVQRGPYKILRHPGYTGALIGFLGIGISTNNWINMIIFFVAMGLFYVYRIPLEERMLLDHFGDAYREYQKKTYG